MRAFQHPEEYIPPGRYTRLMLHGSVMMSDTPSERISNRFFVMNAHGRILIAGLGLGLIVFAALERPEVEHITIVEKYRDVIELVATTLTYRYGDHLSIVESDIHSWRPKSDETYNVIYFDIWPDIRPENLTEMDRLHRRFAKRLDKGDPHRWMDSWERDRLLRLRRERRRSPWGRF